MKEGRGAHPPLDDVAATRRASLRLSEDLPLLIEVVDKADAIEKILPILDEMVTEGLVTMENVEIVKYRAEEGTS
jgi:PII-like signaling protein